MERAVAAILTVLPIDDFTNDPVRRMEVVGKPEELANATVFLCSERASYITGVSLNLDGGRLKGLW